MNYSTTNYVVMLHKQDKSTPAFFTNDINIAYDMSNFYLLDDREVWLIRDTLYTVEETTMSPARARLLGL